MKNNETGEFELVLGNRQLLSGFFIVVLLFGVAFAMGYIVGRSSAPSSKLQAEAATSNARPDARPDAAPAGQPAQASSQSAPAASDQGQPPASDTAAADAAPPPAEPTTQPARDVASPPASQPPAAPADAAEPTPGTYWQVMALKQAEAEIVLRTLKDKGFPASLGPGPNNLVRVLVGPYSDTQSLGRAKSELENADFHPILKK
ncbi:MAG TPA: SPOR domain-containing protein [Bryobacteraceae bacterium]|nr:SPOR domain-containing protein [Bryobacteraceae bacterium]